MIASDCLSSVNCKFLIVELKILCRRPFLGVGPLQVGNAMVSPPLSPHSIRDDGLPIGEVGYVKQTLLQRNLAHLARHGFNGVASGPGDSGETDTISEDMDSRRDSLLTNGVGGVPMTTIPSGASVTASTMGSIGSIKGRFSKLNFGRQS